MKYLKLFEKVKVEYPEIGSYWVITILSKQFKDIPDVKWIAKRTDKPYSGDQEIDDRVGLFRPLYFDALKIIPELRQEMSFQFSDKKVVHYGIEPA